MIFPFLIFIGLALMANMATLVPIVNITLRSVYVHVKMDSLALVMVLMPYQCHKFKFHVYGAMDI